MCLFTVLSLHIWDCLLLLAYIFGMCLLLLACIFAVVLSQELAKRIQRQESGGRDFDADEEV